VRKEVRTMIQPMIGTNIKLGKPRVPDEHATRAERLDAKFRQGDSVADYQRRVLGQIEGLDWASEGGDEREI
jgi:hypothetical protein